ncbi:aminoglycoside phosphotransferase family protein [Brevibacillus borstelensis]|uniref:aminoglycoside phosphotransferase family protein n=1 Tax=Brevibacillus borstelensis TaxID=45462 RepID=UPI0030C2D386
MDEIKTMLKEQYGIDCTNVLPQQGGWSALAYKVLDDQRAYFLKVYEKSRASTSKWTALIDMYMPVTVWLQQNSSLKGKIPVPLFTTNGDYKCESEDAIYLLFQYIDGETIGNRELSKEQLYQLSEIVAELHSYGEEISVKTEELREDFEVPFLQELRNALDNDLNKLSTDVAEMIEPWVERIKGLSESVRRLSASLKNNQLRTALCHTDLHNWNLMQAEGKLVLIDWEGLTLAPVEADLMFLVDHPHFDTFLSIYRKRHKAYALNRDALQFYQEKRKLEDIWEFIQQLLFDEQDAQERAETISLLAKELKTLV